MRRALAEAAESRRLSPERAAPGIACDVGDVVSMVVEPTSTAKAFAKACEQSKKTTAPGTGGKGRADAIDMPKTRARK